MPRNAMGVMERLPNTTAIPNTVASSTAFNTVIDDIIAEMNLVLPKARGGTGSTTGELPEPTVATLRNVLRVNAAGDAYELTPTQTVNTRDFMAGITNDDEAINAAIAYAESINVGEVVVHDKGSNWSIRAQLNNGSVCLRAEKWGIVLSLDASSTYFSRQTTSQSGGGFVGGFDIRLNDNFTLFGLRSQGSDYKVIGNKNIDGGTPRTGFVLITVDQTAENARVYDNDRIANCGTLIQIRSNSLNTYIDDNRNFEEYQARAVQVRMENSPRGNIHVRNNTFGLPANLDGSNAKQPFAVSVGGASTYAGFLYVESNKFHMSREPHQSGVINRGCADVISFHGTSNSVCRDNRVYGGGELGIQYSLGGDSNEVLNNTVQDCDVGGISFGTSVSATASFNVCSGNIVRNGAMEVLDNVVIQIGDYYAVNQDFFTFTANTGINTITGANATDYGYVTSNCTNLKEHGNSFSGHAIRPIFREGSANTYIEKQYTRFKGLRNAVLEGNATIANNAVGHYIITLNQPLENITDVHITITISFPTATQIATVVFDSTTQISIYIADINGTPQNRTFTWEFYA